MPENQRMDAGDQPSSGDGKLHRHSRPGSSHDPPSFSDSNDTVGSLLSSPAPTHAEASNTSLSGGTVETPSLSSYSSSSDRQLGHGVQETSEPADRVFPIRSVLSVDSSGRALGERPEFFSRSSHGSPQPGRAEASHGSDTPFTASKRSRKSGSGSITSDPTISGSPHPGKGPTRSRKNTLRPGLTSTDSVTALPIFSADLSDEELSQSDTAGDGLGIANARPSPSAAGSLEEEPLVTVRFRHVVTEDGHAVITGREETLQRCEDEPIHAPGAVQGFGLLIAIAEEPDGRFLVRYASENSKRIIGYSPKDLFGLRNFLDLLTDEQADNLLDHIDFIRDEEADPAANGPEVFSMSIRPAKAKAVKLWCAIHVNPACPEFVICEFELDDDVVNPLRPPGEDTPDLPEDTLNSNPTTEELNESTEVLSRPLRVLRSARKRRGESGAMQVFDIMSQVQEQLAAAESLEKFLKILVGIVKELTGFHRIMVYQFDSVFNGKVVTELVDPQQTRDLYKGLHFPASDIPRQARELYKINKVRLLYDRDQETARLVCRTPADLEQTLDLTHSYLRAMSPIHLKYLGNMAVRSSMSISVNAFNELWGLIACHSYGPRGMRVSFPIRKMCRLIGETASRNIERLSYASRLQARKLINTIPTEKNPSGYIIASSDDLLRLFDADFGMLSIQGETKILGKVDQSQEALVMLEYLRLRKLTSVTTTQDVRVDFPDLRYPPGFQVVAGLLYVPLSVGGNDFIVFFRKGQIREVKWAGNPYDKVVREGTAAYLEPRKSFRVWHETVLGKCREWSEEQVETAAVLCLVYGKFIEVWRQKEAALQNSRLTRLLLANSAHEVRTPLNAIINYLEIAMEGTLDQETRDNLSRSHSASKSLIYVINDLLDLTKTEEGQELVKDEAFDLPACIREATDPFQTDAKRKGIEYEVIEHPGVPQLVCGDQRRVRQAVANITANAMQHTTEGWVKVEVFAVEVLDRKVRVEIAVQDTGSGMDDSQLDAMFRDLEQVSDDANEADVFSSDRADTKSPGHTESPADGAEGGKRALGLGLAVVARIVRNMDGQLRLKSEPGKGSRFVMQLAFDLPPQSEPEAKAMDGFDTQSIAASSTVSVHDSVCQEGEVTLVERGTSTPAATAAPATPATPATPAAPAATTTPAGPAPTDKGFDAASITSQRSTTSRGSGRSSRSDADRLIDAIQTPLAIGEPEPTRIGLQRRSSRGLYYNQHANSAGQTSDSVRSLSPAPMHPADREIRQGIHRPASVPALGDNNGLAPVVTGVQYVTDSRTPLRPVRIPDVEEYRDQPMGPQPGQTSGVLFELSPEPKPASTFPDPTPTSPQTKTAGPQQNQATPQQQLGASLQVLCAEDDPINMKLLRKRLEKAGHGVFHAVNGEDCASAYKEKPKSFDVVLMDMQMPIADGLASTKMIRAFECSEGAKPAGLSEAANGKGRIPIFAVSASLLESKKDSYVRAGFDGWILKPVDFKRLNTLLSGIHDAAVRRDCLYRPGSWERGGWFDREAHQQQQKPSQPHTAGTSDGVGAAAAVAD